MVGIVAVSVPLFEGIVLNVPRGYVSGTALSDLAIYSGKTFATLGVTPGTYLWTWGAGANQNFTLKILPEILPAANITNFSTRASVQTGQGVTIAGFIITGTGSKSVVVRGSDLPLPSRHSMSPECWQIRPCNSSIVADTHSGLTTIGKTRSKPKFKRRGLHHRTISNPASCKSCSRGIIPPPFLAKMAPPVSVWSNCMI